MLATLLPLHEMMQPQGRSGGEAPVTDHGALQPTLRCVTCTRGAIHCIHVAQCALRRMDLVDAPRHAALVYYIALPSHLRHRLPHRN